MNRTVSRHDPVKAPRHGPMDWTAMLLIAATAAAGVAGFALAEMRLAGGWGFPLDDSWIHLQFARNLRAGQGFVFNPGEPSAGATAPLWTLLVGALMWLPADPLLSVKVVGAILLAVNGWLTCQLARATGLERRWALLAGITVVLTPRLLWASLSGMEVMLYVALATAGIGLHVRTMDRTPSLAGTGLLALAALARPECLMLFPLALTDRWRRDGWRQLGRQYGRHLLLYLLLLAPFVWLNYRAIGRPLPGTFYAKVGDYGLLGSFDLGRLARVFGLYPLLQTQELMQFSAENSLLLTFLAPMGIVELLRRRRHARSSWMLPLVIVGFPVLRGVLAPFKGATFQQGRYAAFLIPLLTTVGVIGVRAGLRLLRDEVPRSRVDWVRRWGMTAVWGMMLFNLVPLNVYAARTYGRNVREIQTMHVSIGRWLAVHTPAEAVVAANDIGAIGYFSGRRILDIVGLVTPDVLSYLPPGQPADRGVEQFLNDRQPDYLVILPNWYPELSRRQDLLRPVHEITLDRPTIAGGNRMVVYRMVWDRP